MNSLKSIPLVLEDRTAAITNTDFDDMYDRVFLHISRIPGQSTTNLYEMQVRASRHRSREAHTVNREPTISLEFLQDETLGTVTFPKHRMAIPMSRYLRKLSFFGPSLCRKFAASDGREYKWSYRALDDHEWTCSTADESNYLVAHYNVRPPSVPMYDNSGNKLTIYPHFTHLTTELVASLLIMRHIAQFNL
ncbi:hypothetical protein FA15DRAFT_671112 [Coprinopsis marcescibilis]|uniref:DUF6593 domain-containing protein n=1 Tax=Coprinopsis marcescibilis TaxID=230819 RepID=A0A5C3KQT2_COPMA|nr:hypothetical protein FA15DRAFT_671112 [Coprinopsis marcescibilis]